MNNFNSLSSNQYTFASVNRNINLLNGDLYKNTFNGNFQSATQVEGAASSKLQIDCNRYLGNNTYDWSILSELLADQGECLLDATSPATNIFSPCTNNDNSNIWSITSFNYSSTPNFSPSCVSNSVIIENCQDNNNYENSCPQLVNVPCPQCITGLGQQLGFTPPGQKRNKIKGELVRRLAQEGNIALLLSYLHNDGTNEDKKIAIPTLVKQREYQEARDLLNELVLETYEDQQFKELFDVLITSGQESRSLKQLTTSEVQTIEEVAYTGTDVAVLAEAVLAERNHTKLIRFPQLADASGMSVQQTNNTTVMGEIKALNSFELYPNPSNGDIEVKIHAIGVSEMTIFDMLGKIIQQKVVLDDASVQQFKELCNGIYMLRVKYNDGTSESKSFIVK
jgi:hypothetical protein